MSRTVVVGAGAIGLGCAYELARRGRQVTVLDKGLPGRACSEGNAGWITPSISAPLPAPGLTWTSIKWMLSKDSPLYISPTAAPKLARWLWRFWRYCNAKDHEAGFRAVAELNRLTLPLFDELANDGFPFELHRQGLLCVFRDQGKAEQGRAEAELMTQYGYPKPTPLAAAELRRMEPVLSDEIVAGHYVEREYHIRPESLSEAYVTRVSALGGEVRRHVEVSGPLRANGRVIGVETSTGPIEADQILLAAGAWTGLLAARFGLRLPVEAGKGYSLTVETATPAFSRPLYLGDVKVGATPFTGAYRFAGTMELSGINTELDRRRLEGVLHAVGRYFREPLAARPGREWVGMRPMTPDGLPMIGRAPGVDNVFIATGHAMLGITLAPATGRVVSELMAGERPSAPLAPFEPGRFNW